MSAPACRRDSGEDAAGSADQRHGEGISMKRAAGWLVTLAAASGCVSTEMDGMTRGNLTGGYSASGSMPRPPMLSGVVGTYGEPVAMQPPIGPNAPGSYGGVGPEVVQAGMPGVTSPLMPP